ncbi:MAG TPA: DUF1003 domain-containing protein [Bryobacteraceae bacterium]|nr:DUF1003 domain-containing protein [Bryobacteraceae bacterium]
MRKEPLPTAITNIETVAKLEQEFLETRTALEKVSDAIGAFVGTMGFVSLHVVWFIGWVLVNTRMIPGVPTFDPYPFMLLSMVVSLEGVLLTTFVLMKQNRMSRRADNRNQLNLQVDLLAEREVTKIIQMLQVVCAHMGLEAEAQEKEVQELSQNTAVDVLAKELREKMPD